MVCLSQICRFSRRVGWSNPVLYALLIGFEHVYLAFCIAQSPPWKA